MGYQDNYANNVAQIYQNLGNAQAQARLQQGAGWANAFGQIGQLAAGIPGQLAQQKKDAQQEARLVKQDEVLDMNLQQLKTGVENQKLLTNVMNSSVVNGKIDEARFTENAQLAGIAQLVPDALKTLRDSDRAMVELNNARTSGKLSQAALSQLEMNYIRTLAPSLVDSKFNPIVVDAILEKAKLDGFDVEPWRQLATTDPQQFHDAVTQMVTPKKDLMNIPDGGVVFDPNTGKPVYENEKPVQILSLEDQLAAAVAARDGAEVSRIRNEMAKNAAATRAPERPKDDSFTPKRVLKQDGTVGAALYNSRTGKFTDPETGEAFPYAMEVSDSGIATLQNKAKLDTIVRRMNELSEKINVSEGLVASAKGFAAQQAAKVNLDDDVAEYESLVSVYTPIFARSNGHTGVLTQIDVDSTKAGFPHPQNSKTLRDRKVKIMTEVRSAGDSITGTQSGGGDATQKPTLSADGLTVMTAAGPMTFPTKEAALGYYNAIGGGQ
jgi:hypothetical protein